MYRNQGNKRQQKYSGNKTFLTDHEKNNITKRFPDFELSYEKLVHKKVSSDIYVAIPKGKKYIVWFTYFKDKNVCFLMELLGKRLVFKSMENVSVSFRDSLSFGTILYGTLINYDKKRLFAIENIYYYKGKDISKNYFSDKLKIMKSLFQKEVRQLNLGKNSLLLGLPIIKKTYQETIDACSILPYQIYCIQSRLVNRHANFLNYLYEETQKNLVFQIRADVQNDIYNLYCYKNGDFEFFDIAQIQDYKTSVLMNKLFRKIRENENLDYLEESEDEEDFENVSEDKFVNLEKKVNMVCSFSKKFNKWVPERTVSFKDKITTYDEIKMIHNKNTNYNGYSNNKYNGNQYGNQNGNMKNYKRENTRKNRYVNNYGKNQKRDFYKSTANQF